MFFKKSKNSGKLKQSPVLVPKLRRDDDIFLVSFPKSGVTWVSFLIANLINKTLNLNQIVNFFNINGFVPDIHCGTDIPLDLGFFPFKRIIKSHSRYTPFYKNIIYILRDPRSVMVSYHKYMQGVEGYEGTLSEFIDDPAFGINAWVNHLSGWIDAISPYTRFRIVRYEDLKLDVNKELENLAYLLGIKLDEFTAGQIIHDCSFENMRKLEEESRSLSLIKKDEKFRFIRKGSSISWKEELTENEIYRIESVAHTLMQEHGYCLNNDTLLSGRTG